MTAQMKLLDGKTIPIIALGTWNDESRRLVDGIKQAFALGYRHLDLAYKYDNEHLINVALNESGLNREQVFVTNKLACCKVHDPAGALNESLNVCGLDYFDLYLMHWPMSFVYRPGEKIPLDDSGYVIPSDKDYVDTWKEMIECRKTGKIKSIGVSNFNEKQLQRLYDEGGHEWPTVNQIEVNPYCPSWELVKFCQDRGIIVSAYGLLGSLANPWRKDTDPILLNDPTLKDICNKLNDESSVNWTPAKLIIKWITQRNIVAIVKSVTKERLEGNISALNLPDIPSWAMQAIANIETRFRFYQQRSMIKHPEWPYEVWDQ